VFEDRTALVRSRWRIRKTLAVIEESLAGEPEAPVFHVSSSEPWGA
jgi:hypothetical protein